MKTAANTVDYLLCFDTTGSMYSVVGEVKKRIAELTVRLAKEVPGVRIAIGAVGDYCDRPPRGPYVTKYLDFTTDMAKVQRFIKDVENTSGGDSDECYELLFHEARDLSWGAGANKAMVLVADANPHGPSYPDNVKRLDWRKEVEKLGAKGIKLYAVQALSWNAPAFYQEVAKLTGGFHLRLNQFSTIADILMAVGLQQSDDVGLLARFEEEMKARGLYSRAVSEVFDTLLARKTSTADRLCGKVDGLKAVPLGRFQMLDVPKDYTIADFVRDNALPFEIGRGFYEFTKRETIQDHKEVVLLDKHSGDMYTGAAAREMLDLPAHGAIRLSPKSLDKYAVFVQSTSANRKLIGGTRFLYEVNAH